MPHPIPYLAFDGNCAEAMRFYETALQARLEILMDGASSPMAGQIPPDQAHRILHARLALPDGGLLYGGDSPCHMPYHGIKGVSLTLNYDTPDEAGRIFAALAEGGSIQMPIQPTFWAAAFGMLTDRFGVAWQVNGGLAPMVAA